MAKIKATKKDWQVDDVLNLIFDCDLGEVTIREYLVELSRQVWIHDEGFSGKRPFGNSEWKGDVYTALAIGGFIDGEQDEDGYWFDTDDAEGDRIIEACFNRLKSPT